MKSTLSAVFAALSLLMAAGMTGGFFVFTVGVMPGLNAARPGAAIAAMQGINQKIQNPVFLGTFMLLPVAAVVAGILLLTMDERPSALFFFAAAAVYVVGAIAPTAVVNVPMNNALDAVTIPSDAAEAAKTWADYTGRWTAWNTLRAVFCGVSLLLMAAGVYTWGRNG